MQRQPGQQPAPSTTSPSFRIQGKYFFLTYSQFSGDPNDLLLHLLDLKPGHPQHIRVARERHNDGHFHLHAGIRYSHRIDIRSQFHFDWNSGHPNIQKCSTWGAVLRYLTKDGEYYDFLDDNVEEDDNSGRHVPIDYADRVYDFTTYGEWLNFAVANNLSFGYAHAFWTDSRRDTTATILEPEDPNTYLQYIGPQLLDYDWIDDDTSYIVRGPSGIGKTNWCKHWAPKPALFISHVDALRQFVPGYHVSIIFDDVSFHHLPAQSQIHLADCYDTRQIHMRHRVTQIPARTKKFFSINPPYQVFIDMPAIERRVTLIDI
jgi:hypothetical protein